MNWQKLDCQRQSRTYYLQSKCATAFFVNWLWLGCILPFQMHHTCSWLKAPSHRPQAPIGWFPGLGTIITCHSYVPFAANYHLVPLSKRETLASPWLLADIQPTWFLKCQAWHMWFNMTCLPFNRCVVFSQTCFCGVLWGGNLFQHVTYLCDLTWFYAGLTVEAPCSFHMLRFGHLETQMQSHMPKGWENNGTWACARRNKHLGPLTP